MKATETVTTLLSAAAGGVSEKENGEITQEHPANNSTANCNDRQEFTVSMTECQAALAKAQHWHMPRSYKFPGEWGMR